MLSKTNARSRYWLAISMVLLLLIMNLSGCHTKSTVLMGESQTLTTSPDPNRVCISVGYYDALLRARDYAVEKGYRW